MSASIYHFTATSQNRHPLGVVPPAPTFRGRDYEAAARAIGAARAARDLETGTLPAGIDALDWWHMAEITGTPDRMLSPDEYRLLVGFADGGYWTAIDEAIPDLPETNAVAILDEDGEPDTLDLSSVRIVRPCWRARMDETLCILLDEFAHERRYWRAAHYCAAYARLAGPAGAAAVFGDRHE